MEHKVDVTMLADAQGFKEGDIVNCTPLRAVRWCDIMGIAARKTTGISRSKKEKKRAAIASEID